MSDNYYFLLQMFIDSPENSNEQLSLRHPSCQFPALKSVLKK